MFQQGLLHLVRVHNVLAPGDEAAVRGQDQYAGDGDRLAAALVDVAVGRAALPQVAFDEGGNVPLAQEGAEVYGHPQAGQVNHGGGQAAPQLHVKALGVKLLPLHGQAGQAAEKQVAV